MRALPHKHRSGLRYFIPSPPFSLHTLVYLALFLYAGFASQTSGLCSAILLAPFNLHALLHSAIFLYACFLPQKHRNFLSHAHCHITCRMITLAYCGMLLTFRLSVVTAGCDWLYSNVSAASCTSTTILHMGKRRRRTITYYDGNLDSQSSLLVKICNIFGQM